mmetsp:Transcript_40411/g.101098  ORF Transcript_40411/g.101098 Transcript_40411/m.101098 type:complete len:244 (+) Transcript_40411:378-1109(+)
MHGQGLCAAHVRRPRGLPPGPRARLHRRRRPREPPVGVPHGRVGGQDPRLGPGPRGHLLHALGLLPRLRLGRAGVRCPVPDGADHPLHRLGVRVERELDRQGWHRQRDGPLAPRARGGVAGGLHDGPDPLGLPVHVVRAQHGGHERRLRDVHLLHHAQPDCLPVPDGDFVQGHRVDALHGPHALRHGLPLHDLQAHRGPLRPEPVQRHRAGAVALQGPPGGRVGHFDWHRRGARGLQLGLDLG